MLQPENKMVRKHYLLSGVSTATALLLSLSVSAQSLQLLPEKAVSSPVSDPAPEQVRSYSTMAFPSTTIHDRVQSAVRSELNYPVNVNLLLPAGLNPNSLGSFDELALLVFDNDLVKNSKKAPAHTQDLPGQEYIPEPPEDGNTLNASHSGCDIIFPPVGTAFVADYEWRWQIHEDTNSDGVVNGDDEPGWQLVNVSFAWPQQFETLCQ
jgi:hypothetical protein